MSQMHLLFTGYIQDKLQLFLYYISYIKHLHRPIGYNAVWGKSLVTFSLNHRMQRKRYRIIVKIDKPGLNILSGQ